MERAIVSSRWLLQVAPILLWLTYMSHRCLVYLVLVSFLSGVSSGSFATPKSPEKWSESPDRSRSGAAELRFEVGLVGLVAELGFRSPGSVLLRRLLMREPKR